MRAIQRHLRGVVVGGGVQRARQCPVRASSIFPHVERNKYSALISGKRAAQNIQYELHPALVSQAFANR